MWLTLLWSLVACRACSSCRRFGRSEEPSGFWFWLVLYFTWKTGKMHISTQGFPGILKWFQGTCDFFKEWQGWQSQNKEIYLFPFTLVLLTYLCSFKWCSARGGRSTDILYLRSADTCVKKHSSKSWSTDAMSLLKYNWQSALKCQIQISKKVRSSSFEDISTSYFFHKANWTSRYRNV